MDATTTQYRDAVSFYRAGNFVRAHFLAACLDGAKAKKLERMSLVKLAGGEEEADAIEEAVAE